MVKEDSYVCIQAFMLNDLHLKGNELIVYAVIFGYTQDGEHWYYGTRAHLAEWCGATKGTVSNCLRSLVEKGFLIRRQVERFGMLQVQYQAVAKEGTTVPKITSGGNKNCDTPLSKISSNDSIEPYSNATSNDKRFVPPKPSDVSSYMQGRGTPIDAEAFCDYWESVGWIRGKTKMRDWKAAARQWEKNQRRWKKNGVKWDAELEELADGL